MSAQSDPYAIEENSCLALHQAPEIETKMEKITVHCHQQKCWIILTVNSAALKISFKLPLSLILPLLFTSLLLLNLSFISEYINARSHSFHSLFYVKQISFLQYTTKHNSTHNSFLGGWFYASICVLKSRMWFSISKVEKQDMASYMHRYVLCLCCYRKRPLKWKNKSIFRLLLRLCEYSEKSFSLHNCREYFPYFFQSSAVFFVVSWADDVLSSIWKSVCCNLIPCLFVLKWIWIYMTIFGNYKHYSDEMCGLKLFIIK